MAAGAHSPAWPVQRLALFAHAARTGAAAVRWMASLAIGFAGLLVVALICAAFDRTRVEERTDASAAAWLDLDLAVLREASARSFANPEGDAHAASARLWAQRPAWELPETDARATRLVPLRDAWAATAAPKGRFRTAALGAVEALPFLVAGLLLVLFGAAVAGALAEALRAPRHAHEGRAASLRRATLPLLTGAAAVLLVGQPLLLLLDASVFHGRTVSVGLGLTAVAFVAAFAGTLPAAAIRAYLGAPGHVQYLGALGGRPAIWIAARTAALAAADRLVPLVPALAAAAVFVCAKADQDPALQGAKSGLGALIRAALREPSAAERVASTALIAGALVLLWFAGHRLVLEVQSALRPRSAP